MGLDTAQRSREGMAVLLPEGALSCSRISPPAKPRDPPAQLLARELTDWWGRDVLPPEVVLASSRIPPPLKPRDPPGLILAPELSPPLAKLRGFQATQLLGSTLTWARVQRPAGPASSQLWGFMRAGRRGVRAIKEALVTRQSQGTPRVRAHRVAAGHTTFGAHWAASGHTTSAQGAVAEGHGSGSSPPVPVPVPGT